MIELVKEHGTRYWTVIGQKLNNRTGKQVCKQLLILTDCIILYFVVPRKVA
jgi:hypothetical protein